MQGNDNPEPVADSVDSASLRDYAARMLAQRLKTMLSLVDEVRKSADTEAVHKMRVASRRTRVALDVFQICSKNGHEARLKRDIKRVTDALSEARDLDVMQETLVKEMRDLPAEQRVGVEGFVKELRTRRRASQRSVVKTVKRLERDDLKERIDAVVAAKSVHRRDLRGGNRLDDTHG